MNYEYTGQQLWYQKPIKALLPYISDKLKSLDIPFWLDWGTLLGAVRNGKMIPWDFDIDIGIFQRDAERMLKVLKSVINKDGYDFAVDRNRKYARKIRFFGREGFDFHIDIDPWNEYDTEARAAFDESKIRPLGELNNLEEIMFEGAMYPCPKNLEVGLTRLIGKDWRTKKVSSGNVIYIKKYDPDNKDILDEISKYKG